MNLLLSSLLVVKRRRTRLLLALCLFAPAVLAQQFNGFEIGNATVPVAEIRRGGPPRDGIPALTDPAFEEPAEAGLWQADDRMLVLDIDGVSFAYPVVFSTGTRSSITAPTAGRCS